MAEPLLEVKSLRKVFRGRSGVHREEFVAVDDVSFEVPVGGSVAIVGESGSGKTTCARIVTGLERATAGEIRLDGVLDTGSSLAQRRRRASIVQMVFQDPYQSLDRRQTIKSCLAEVVGHHTRLDKDTRIAELLDLVGLDQRHGASLPRALSGGQRQRVAIARALAANPKLLVLDEAVAALDVSIQAQILNLLADARAATGVAYLFITHDLSVVRHVCESVVVMAGGKVVEAGPVEQVLHEPSAEYTQRLVGSIPRPGWIPTRRGAGRAV